MKDYNSESGRERKDFSYFDKLDAILGHRSATQPEHVIDTSAPGMSDPVREEANTSTVSEPEMKGTQTALEICQEKAALLKSSLRRWA